MGRSAGSPGFDQAVALAGLLVNSDRSSHRIDSPGQVGFNNTDKKGTIHLQHELESGGIFSFHCKESLAAK